MVSIFKQFITLSRFIVMRTTCSAGNVIVNSRAFGGVDCNQSGSFDDRDDSDMVKGINTEVFERFNSEI